MELVFKYKGVEHRLDIAFDSSTLAEVGVRLQDVTSAHFSTQKLIGPNLKGVLKLAEHPSETLMTAGVLPGKRYTLMGSTQEDVQCVQSLKDLPRMPGVEEEMRREIQRSTYAPQTLKPPNEEFTFGRYEVLNRAGLHPPPSSARDLLYRLANDTGIIGIMKKHKWKVGLLSEMPPEGKVGISRACVLGYNVNKGQEIALRLRTDDLKGFRKYIAIRETLIHELTHMVWSEHDENFWKLNSQLLKEYDTLLQRSQGGILLSGESAPFREEDMDAPYSQASDGRRLGGESTGQDAAAAARDAAIQRQKLMLERHSKDNP